LFHEVAFEGRVFYERDVHLVWYPYLEAVRHCLQGHSWPLWNSFISFGEPLLANPSTQLFYPFTWLALVSTPALAYILLVLFHSTFSGFGLFVFARRLSLSPFAAFVASVAWILSGPFLSMVTLWHHFVGFSWLPWILFATDRACNSPSFRRTLLLGAVLGAQIVAGSADACAITGLLVLGFASCRPGSNRAAGLPSIALGYVLALGLSAGQWIPALELANRVARWDLPSSTRTYWSVHPLMTLQFFLPFRWDELPLRPDLKSLFFEGREPFLPSLYLGMPVLGLALASFVRPSRPQLFFALVALLASAFALGKFAPFHAVALWLLPPLRILRYPVKATMATAFSTAILSGMGLDRATEFIGRSAQKGAAVLVGLGAPVLTGVFVWADLAHFRLTPMVVGSAELTAGRIQGASILAALGLLGWLLVFARRVSVGWGVRISGLFVVLDLLLALATLNRTALPDFFRYRPPIVSALREPGFERIHVREYLVFGSNPSPDDLQRYHLDLTGLDERTAAVKRALSSLPGLYPPSPGRWDLESSYDTDMLGLYPKPLDDLTKAVRAADGGPGYVPLLRLGAVDRLVTLQPLGLQGLAPRGVFESLHEEPVHFYGVTNPLPRCYAVGTAEISDDSGALALLSDPAFPAASTVVLPAGSPASAGDFEGSCSIKALVSDRVELEVFLNRPGYVVLVDSYDPGWKASVDGASAPLLRADLAFRAVAVASGAHTVQMVYRPWSVRLGIPVSLLSVLAWGLAFARSKKEP
jgi:hypothetical protein